MDWTDINKKTIKKLPQRDWDKISKYNYILIVPSGLKHDSGFMMQAIVGCKGDGTFEVCGYPDDIVWDFTGFNQKFPSLGMRTDCSYPKGNMRFWRHEIEFEVGVAMSSIDIKVTNK